MEIDFKGTGVAMVTPFNEDKTVDYIGLSNLIEYIIDGGVEFLVSLGTTGESALQTTMPAGTTLFMNITAITLTSGIGIGYHEGVTT